MEDIAIYFEKINLGYDRYVFKPVNIIRGVYLERTNQFVTDYGVPCQNISCSEYYDYEDFFHCQTTIKELKEKFGSENTIESLLSEYFELCSDYCYIGYYSIKQGRLNCAVIPYDMIENIFDRDIVAVNGGQIEFVEGFIDTLKDLRDSKSLKEVRSKLDQIINMDDPKFDKLSKNYLDNEVSLKKEESKGLTLKELRKDVLSKIKGQDNAVYDITRSIMINQTSSDPRNKSHILVTGPTGTGKTEIIKIICENLNLPLFEADATAYTKEGYVGKSVYSMLSSLIDMADGDIEKAQNGILIIDEIDKKLSSRDDVSGVDVLYSLLKIMDRGVIEVDRGGRTGLTDKVMFDTSNLTIIFIGAFENLYQKKLKQNKHVIGFNSIDTQVPQNEIVVTKEDLIKEGVPSEFLGRIGDVTSTNFFKVEDLVNILTNSKISALLIQQKYFKEKFNVDLKYTSDYTYEIANKAIKTKTNARELKSLVKDSLKIATDELLSGEKIKVLKLTKETAIDNKKFYVE